ncbi:hypothetical protein E3P96_02363 [Wallemia ichthyophaga]|nr:hypothetical protein E3P96_02363 [Wallemia ichthyophaga]
MKTPPRPKSTKLSETCAPPPETIRDKKRNKKYSRHGLLGEGGFARVYEVEDDHGGLLAIKTISKTALQSKKNRTKLYAEIKLHKALSHPNIVGFEECFEDEENVYMLMELCKAGNMMDLLRARKRYTAPETRFFLVQLIGACQYMHEHSVIHRDLKLGNLFLDESMNVKVGDFGLAALIEREGERKKTICGTPNYIAPEVLFDTSNGHSFEVDVWSIGVIMYTLLVGKPPFQTKDVKEIYKRIKDNLYEFPVDDPIPTEAEDLISCILTPDPNDRPTLHEILDHPFFSGITPPSIPSTARMSKPDFSNVTNAMSKHNMRRLRQQVELDISRPIAAKNGEEKTESVSVAEQEREFNKAVQPSSPISTLLSSARQPLIVANSLPSQPLLRQATTAALAEKEKKQKMEIHASNKKYMENLEKKDGEDEEIADQKLRIVSEMVNNDEKNKGKARALDENNQLPPPKSKSKSSCFVEMHTNLHNAFIAKREAKRFEIPSQYRDTDSDKASKVFIVSWLDYCNKYGMGYALTDGTVGVYFNDSTSMVLSPAKETVDYIASRGKSSTAVRKNFNIDKEIPKDLESKMLLLRHFEDYMLERLYGARSYTYVDEERRKGMTFVQRYYRMKNLIVFKLSNDVVQFNFYDHTKMILSQGGCLVTYIDKDYALSRWTLDEILEKQSKDEREKKKMEGILVKLKYCKDVFATGR